MLIFQKLIVNESGKENTGGSLFPLSSLNLLLCVFSLKYKAWSQSDRVILVTEPLDPLRIPLCRFPLGNLLSHRAFGLRHVWPLISFTHTNKPVSLNALKLWGDFFSFFFQYISLRVLFSSTFFSLTKFPFNTELKEMLNYNVGAL